MAENDSMYNTPPTYQIYVLGLMLDWVEKNGGLAGMEKRNKEKSELLYNMIDNSNGYYKNPLALDSRSMMNVVFRLPNEDLEAKFVKESAAAGMSNLKGHRSAGGIRASIYNAMSLEGVQYLVDFMKKFMAENPA